MKTVYYIPNGTKNLRDIFPGVDWDNMEEYFVESFTASSAIQLSTGRTMRVDSCDEAIRLHFLTSLGAVDSVSTTWVKGEHDNKGGQFERPISYPLVKSEHGINRLNIKANDMFTVVILCREEDVKYYEELLDSPMAWMEWEGTQSQPDDYIPIVITSKKTENRKFDDRYEYEIQVEFSLSHEKNIIRN